MSCLQPLISSKFNDTALKLAHNSWMPGHLEISVG